MFSHNMVSLRRSVSLLQSIPCNRMQHHHNLKMYLGTISTEETMLLSQNLSQLIKVKARFKTPLTGTSIPLNLCRHTPTNGPSEHAFPRKAQFENGTTKREKV